MKIINGICFFWKEFLSNWQESPFQVNHNGLVQQYNCVEQYMMAEKARTFNDTETLNKILSTKIPKEQKDFGRNVKNYNDEVWANVRYKAVLFATVAKYDQNKDLLDKLLAIECYSFCEASPYDKVWGIGMDENHPDIGDPDKWQGQNLLGKVITGARDILKQNKDTGIISAL
jgi:ribA/ribD-fused uncharacterized protein